MTYVSCVGFIESNLSGSFGRRSPVEVLRDELG